MIHTGDNSKYFVTKMSDATSLDTSKTVHCKEDVEEIVSEYSILKDLYYRNFNQHGGTQVFGLLKKVLRLMRSSYVTDGTTVLQAIDKSFSDIIYSKIKLGDTPFYQHCFQEYFRALSVYVHGIKLCIRMYVILQTLLRSRLFLPVYSVLIASISSLLKLFANISISMHEKCLIFIKFMKEQKVDIDVGVANIRKSDNGNFIMSVRGLTISVLRSIASGKEYQNDSDESIIIIHDLKGGDKGDTSQHRESSKGSQHQDASKERSMAKPSAAVQVDILSISSEEQQQSNGASERKKKKKKRKAPPMDEENEIDQIFGSIG